MKTIGVRALRENPGVLSRSSAAGELVLITNRNHPISLSIPFGKDLLDSGVHVNVALKLYEEGVLTLVKAAKLAKMPIEDFMKHLTHLGIVATDQTSEELESDLNTLSE